MCLSPFISLSLSLDEWNGEWGMGEWGVRVEAVNISGVCRGSCVTCLLTVLTSVVKMTPVTAPLGPGLCVITKASLQQSAVPPLWDELYEAWSELQRRC